jgi:hypothetical protein
MTLKTYEHHLMTLKIWASLDDLENIWASLDDLENIGASHLPRISIAYTGLVAASESRLRHHSATPAPKPWRRTIGVLVDSWFKEIVQILSAVPTTGPMSTYHPRYPDFKPTKWKSLHCTILCSKGEMHPCTGTQDLYRLYSP